jgi:hypothetical protein
LMNWQLSKVISNWSALKTAPLAITLFENNELLKVHKELEAAKFESVRKISTRRS